MSIREIAGISPSASLEEIRQALIELLQWAKERDPQAAGEDTQKFISFEQAVSIGLLKRTSRGYVAGGGSFDDGGWVPDYPDGIDDSSPPTAASGLVVTSVRTGFFIEIDSPNYPQGGENAYTEVWGAKYDGTPPLPQFSDAVFIGQIQGKSGIYLVQAEPGVQQHFWVGTVTRAGIRQIDVQGPTGGLNGVYAVAGKIDDRHIESLSVAKLLTGEIQVGTTISSFGFTGTNTYEWQIDGNGVARFSGVIVRGTVYASAGQIGGADIASSYVASSNYDGVSVGWKLDNTTGEITAFGANIRGTLNASDITAGTLNADRINSGDITRTYSDTQSTSVTSTGSDTQIVEVTVGSVEAGISGEVRFSGQLYRDAYASDTGGIVALQIYTDSSGSWVEIESFNQYFESRASTWFEPITIEADWGSLATSPETGVKFRAVVSGPSGATTGARGMLTAQYRRK